MNYSEAAEVLEAYLEKYSIPKDAQEACELAIAAFKRCEYFDELAERKKQKKEADERKALNDRYGKQRK